MRVRLNNGLDNHYEIGNYVEPLKESQPLMVVADPGKTNMAVLVGRVTGETLRIYEFSGKGMDTSDYCQEFKRFLLDLLRNCKVHEFSQEQAIMKDGMQYYTSQMVLTEIRALLIDLSMTLTGKKPVQINNYAWKSAVLPDGYRGHKEKGSHRFLSELDPSFYSYSHDVTDVICMYQYRVAEYNKTVKLVCTLEEQPLYYYTMNIVGKESIPKDCKFFQFNDAFSCEVNASFFINHCNQVGACKLTINIIPLDAMYKLAFGMYTDSTPYLLVKRKSKT